MSLRVPAYVISLTVALGGAGSNGKNRVSLRGRQVPESANRHGNGSISQNLQTHSDVAARTSPCYLPDGRFKEATLARHRPGQYTVARTM